MPWRCMVTTRSKSPSIVLAAIAQPNLLSPLCRLKMPAESRMCCITQSKNGWHQSGGAAVATVATMATFSRSWLVLRRNVSRPSPNVALLCGDKHASTSTLKLVACSKAMCTWQFIELGIGCDPEFEVRNNPEGVDLLLSMTYAAATSPRRADMLVPFPEAFVATIRETNQQQQKLVAATAASASSSSSPLESESAVTVVRDYDVIVQIMSVLPSASILKEQLIGDTKTTLRSILTQLHPHAFYLVRWVLFTNRSFLKPVDIERVRAEIAPLVLPPTIKQAFHFASLPPERTRDGLPSSGCLLGRAQVCVSWVARGLLPLDCAQFIARAQQHAPHDYRRCLRLGCLLWQGFQHLAGILQKRTRCWC